MECGGMIVWSVVVLLYGVWWCDLMECGGMIYGVWWYDLWSVAL